MALAYSMGAGWAMEPGKHGRRGAVLGPGGSCRCAGLLVALQHVLQEVAVDERLLAPMTTRFRLSQPSTGSQSTPPMLTVPSPRLVRCTRTVSARLKVTNLLTRAALAKAQS